MFSRIEYLSSAMVAICCPSGQKATLLMKFPFSPFANIIVGGGFN